jgi:hypothetical protein
VRDLVHERADDPVGRSVADDDLLALGIAPATGTVLGQLADLDAVAELARQVAQRGARGPLEAVAVRTVPVFDAGGVA